jgi:hypothetical protein
MVLVDFERAAVKQRLAELELPEQIRHWFPLEYHTPRRTTLRLAVLHILNNSFTSP